MTEKTEDQPAPPADPSTAIGNPDVSPPPTAGPEWYRALTSDLDGVSDSILSNNFARDGLGICGAAFRALGKLPDGERTDGWGYILDVASRLWDNGSFRAALILLDTSVLNFAIPDDMRERVLSARTNTRIQEKKIRCEQRFIEGDHTGAISMAETIEGNPEDYVTDLRTRSREIRRTKTLLKIYTAVISAVLLSVSALGLAAAINTARNIQIPSLPGPLPTPMGVVSQQYPALPEYDPTKVQAEREKLEKTVCMSGSRMVEYIDSLSDRSDVSGTASFPAVQKFKSALSDNCQSINITSEDITGHMAKVSDSEIREAVHRLFAQPWDPPVGHDGSSSR